MTAFDQAWNLMKMAWKPDQIEHYGLWGDEQGPLPEPVDAGLFKPDGKRGKAGWFHPYTYEKYGKKKNQWHRLNDQEWALNPHIPGHSGMERDRGGKWTQVDRMMKPLLEALWARGIKTAFSDTGGDLGPNPLYPHREEIEEKSIMGTRNMRDIDDQSGYLFFADPVPEEAQHFPLQSDPESHRRYLNAFDKDDEEHQEGGKYHEGMWDTPVIDDQGPNAGSIIRWEPRHNLRRLRMVYDAFGVPFPEEHMKEGLYQWR